MNTSGSSTRTVEVIRVGTIGLEKDYPGKQVVHLRDISKLYEGPLRGLATAKRCAFRTGHGVTLAEFCRITGLSDESLAAQSGEPHPNVENLKRRHNIDMRFLVPTLQATTIAVEDLFDRIRGKRLAGINVEMWDQISGAYLGTFNTDKHGTLILPTDREFVEVLQWKLAGGGYSDCFNGERAAGMPGLFFYFHCNEGAGSTIKSLPVISGQQATLPGGGVTPPWNWYDSGFFNRPALRVPADPDPLDLIGTDPIGRRSFQFLWYCADPGQAHSLFSYSANAFDVHVTDTGVLEGSVLEGQEATQGRTPLQAETWYLIQINTEMVGGWNPQGGSSEDGAYEYWITMQVYLGGILELSVEPPNPLSPLSESGIPGASNIVTLTGMENDGFDEIRHLDRGLYPSEITSYATFLKNGRVESKSQGSLGSPGW